MSIISILSSLNIIGLIAFLVTLGFLLYEIILLTRTKKTDNMPHVPSFEEGAQPLPPTLQIKENQVKNITKNLTKNNKVLLLTLTILLIFFGSFTLVSSFVNKSDTDKIAVITPTRTVAINRIPTSVISTKVIATPTSADTFFETPTEEPTAEPTEITEAPLAETVSPTVITQLPVTSYINNTLVLFSVAGLFFFFSFLL